MDFKEYILSLILEQNPESILDIACCTGHYVRKLRESGWSGEYTGVDITRNFIEKAKELSPEEEFILGDARSISMDRKYDMVLLLGVIMHLDDYASAMDNAFEMSSNKVIVMTYATKLGYTYCKENGGMLNRYFTEEDIVKESPDGWSVERVEKFHGSRDRWVVVFDARN